MASQRSRFTAHGKKKYPLCGLVDENVVKRYKIEQDKAILIDMVKCIKGAWYIILKPIS